MAGSKRQDGSAAIMDALRSAGIGAAALTSSGLPDFATHTVALADATVVRGRLAEWSAGLERGQRGMVVADRVTGAGRELLDAAGWGWLDRRGHLRIMWPGIIVDIDVPSSRDPVASRAAFSGQVDREVAVLLLLTPDRPAGIRAMAKQLSRAPSSVSAAFTALGAEGLVTADRRPERPELFWALAEHWASPHVDVARLPTRGRDDAVLGVQLDEPESTSGWALTDTVAALAYGAPVAVRADHPPDFHVPDHATLRRAVQLLGSAPSATTRAARLRVAPVSAVVCGHRIDGTPWNQEWPLAHPLFVALDLAQDPGRGREILDAWTPPEPWRRVW